MVFPAHGRVNALFREVLARQSEFLMHQTLGREQELSHIKVAIHTGHLKGEVASVVLLVNQVVFVVRFEDILPRVRLH